MERNEIVRVKQESPDRLPAGRQVDADQQPAALTGEEKKIFDAAFVGLIVGAGLTALLFACM